MLMKKEEKAINIGHHQNGDDVQDRKPAALPQKEFTKMIDHHNVKDDNDSDHHHGRGTSPQQRKEDDDSTDQGSSSINSTSVIAPSPTNDNDSQKSINSNDRQQHSKKKDPYSKALDDDTLQLVKHYLATTNIQDTTLEEEIVAKQANDASRYASERVRYRQNLLEGSDLDEESFYARAHREEEDFVLSLEFFNSVVVGAQEIGSDVDYLTNHGYNPSNPICVDKRTINWIKRASGLQRPHDPLDQQTYLSEEEDPVGAAEQPVLSDNHDDIIKDDTVGASRRLTRGMARTTRVKRREERVKQEKRGLEAMLHAIGELEKERGEFPITPRFARLHERKQSRSPNNGKKPTVTKKGSKNKISTTIKAGASRRLQMDLTEHPYLAATIPGISSSSQRKKSRSLKNGIQSEKRRDIFLTRILVNGKHVAEDGTMMTAKQLSSSRKRKVGPHGSVAGGPSNKKKKTVMKKSISSPEKEDEILETTDDDGSTTSTTSLQGSVVVEKHSKISSQSLALLEKREISPQLFQPNKRKVTELYPDELIKNVRPKWDQVNPAKNVSKMPFIGNPPQVRHPKERYVFWCKGLIDVLNSKARSWVIHEFFYSDIDRAWYNSNEFVADIARLGILPNTKLTRKEWSMVRRHIPNRPKRFSKKFIYSQLQQRNRYRNIVRQIQRNPQEPNILGHDVPAPISVGSTVTAYNKKCRVVHRGIVLYHDVQGHSYLVQFDRKELGFETCPDTEVASHGTPEIVVPANGLRNKSSALDGSNGFLYNTPLPLYGTSSTKSREPFCQYVSTGTELAKFISAGHTKLVNATTTTKATTNTNIPPTDTKTENLELRSGDSFLAVENSNSDESIVETIAERELLVTLMSCIDTALRRKKFLLDAIESFNPLLVSNLPFGQVPFNHQQLSHEMQLNYAWLLTNLETTNATLETARKYLNVMYGKLLVPSSESDVITNPSVPRRALESALLWHSSSPASPSTPSNAWANALVLDTLDVGSRLVENNREALGILTSNEDHQSPDQIANKVLEDRLAATASLLLAVEHCCAGLGTDDGTFPRNFLGMEKTFDASFRKLERLEQNNDDGNNNIENEAINNLLNERSEALSELTRSLTMLKAELAGSCSRGSFA